MTPDDARKAIYQRILNAGLSVVDERIALENRKFTEPESGLWIRLVVQHHPREQVTMGQVGNRKFRSSGIAVAQIFDDIDTGTQQSDILAKELADLFEAVKFNGMSFEAADVREGGPEGQWYMTLVEVPFTYEEVR